MEEREIRNLALLGALFLALAPGNYLIAFAGALMLLIAYYYISESAFKDLLVWFILSAIGAGVFAYGFLQILPSLVSLTFGIETFLGVISYGIVAWILFIVSAIFFYLAMKESERIIGGRFRLAGILYLIGAIIPFLAILIWISFIILAWSFLSAERIKRRKRR